MTEGNKIFEEEMNRLYNERNEIRKMMNEIRVRGRNVEAINNFIDGKITKEDALKIIDEQKEIEIRKNNKKEYAKKYYKENPEKYKKYEERKEYFKKYYKENPEKYYQEDKRKEKIEKSSIRYKERKEEILNKAAENYRKKKEEEYKATHGGSLDGFKGIRNHKPYKK